MTMLFNREWKKSEILQRCGNMDQFAGIRQSILQEGKSRGCRMIDVWTGTGLFFSINAERALDIASCHFNGLPIAWRSPMGDVHPAFYEPQGIGWLRSFPGGLLTTCGLDQFGNPSEENGATFGLHGRISNLPATQVNTCAYWVDDEYMLEISGEIRQSTLFGENIILHRRITSALGANSILIDDTVSNEGFDRVPHMILYHYNLGFPLIGEQTHLKIRAKETFPRDKVAEIGLKDWHKFQEPTPEYQEQVFIHQLDSDEDGISIIELMNPIHEIGLRWSFPTKQLPYLLEWKMMGQGTYVVGIEPANCNGSGGRATTRKANQLEFLEPGESRNYQMNLQFMYGK